MNDPKAAMVALCMSVDKFVYRYITCSSNLHITSAVRVKGIAKSCRLPLTFRQGYGEYHVQTPLCEYSSYSVWYSRVQTLQLQLDTHTIDYS